MKVALVVERFDPTRGGLEVSTAQIAEGLARRGQDVTVFCMTAGVGGQGFRTQELKCWGLDRATRLASFARSVRGAARDGGFDIVHATLPIPAANVFQPRGGLVGAQEAGSLRRRRGMRRFLAQLAQPLNAHHRKMHSMERKLVADPATLCLAVSEMVAREFMNYYARDKNVRVIYNAVDVPGVSQDQRQQWRRERRDQVGVGSGSPLFLFVGMDFRRKGVVQAIRAFARWCRSSNGSPDARFVTVGREDVAAYRRLARKLGVARQVCFEPRADNVWSWYSAADVCVLLSWYDPCSRVVLEAVRWALPSITTVFNGAAEILARGAGLVVSSPDDIDAVVKAMSELSDPGRLAARRQACRDVADELSMDRHVEGLLGAYREVTGRQ
jgi:UDP-glucose:(heptosyl)LPS alpha-1,3-glucosyltransferase